MLLVSGMALSHLPLPRTAPDLRATVSGLRGSALLATETTSPCEVLPSISGLQGVGSGQGWSDMNHHSNTPGLSLAVWALLAGELPCRQGQLHEMTRRLASQCHLPAELMWQPKACKSYPQYTLSPCLETWIQRCVGSGQGSLYVSSFTSYLCGELHTGESVADYCEHCSIASETLNMLGLRPLRNAISFLSFWQTITMGAGQTCVCPALLSAGWQ